MNELRISAADYRALRKHLFQADRDEHGALLLAGQQHRPDGGITFVVREVPKWQGMAKLAGVKAE